MIAVGKLFLTASVVDMPQGPAGWTEVYFFNVAGYSDAATALATLATARKGCLAPDCGINGGTISDTAVKGDSYPSGIAAAVGTYNPGGTMTTYNPDMALRVKFFAGTAKRASRFVRCIPKDSVSADGNFTPVAGFTTALTTFLDAIESEAQMATRIPGATTPPFYTLNAYTSFTEEELEGRKIGRPFSLRRGRRAIA